MWQFKDFLKKDLIYFIRAFNNSQTKIKIKNYSQINKNELIVICKKYMIIKDELVLSKLNPNVELNSFAVKK